MQIHHETYYHFGFKWVGYICYVVFKIWWCKVLYLLFCLSGLEKWVCSERVPWWQSNYGWPRWPAPPPQKGFINYLTPDPCWLKKYPPKLLFFFLLVTFILENVLIFQGVFPFFYHFWEWKDKPLILKNIH